MCSYLLEPTHKCPLDFKNKFTGVSTRLWIVCRIDINQADTALIHQVYFSSDSTNIVPCLLFDPPLNFDKWEKIEFIHWLNSLDNLNFEIDEDNIIDTDEIEITVVTQECIELYPNSM